MLLIFSENQKKRNFHFVPYKYGCFSFQANQDLSTLEKYNLLKIEENNINLQTREDFIKSLNIDDNLNLNNLFNKYSDFSNDDLISFTYNNYPYYALNSKIKNKYLNDNQIDQLNHYINHTRSNTLFSIGYEGKSLEEFVNKLIINNVSTLYDVRKNAFSMKYGFSKKQLIFALENVGINYIHEPNLGIESQKRKKLETKEDYQILFEDYKKNNLIFKKLEINNLKEELSKKNIAIMCFERDHKFCHRSKIEEKLVELDKDLEVAHL